MQDRQQVIEAVNPTWTKDLIIRYLYVKLAPFFERDLHFFFSDQDAQLEYVKQMPQTVGREVICLSLCQFFYQIFEMFNISSKIVATNQKVIPHYALIVEGNRGSYFIDPLKDLMNNQAALKTANYGIIPKKNLFIQQEYPYLIELPLEYRNEMDAFLGLYPNGILNDYLEKIHLELTTNKAYIYLGNYLNKNLETLDRRELYKMKMLFINERFINLANIPGKIERAQYYGCLLCHIFNHSERKNSIIRCEKDMPIVLSTHGTIYVDEKQVTFVNTFE